MGKLVQLSSQAEWLKTRKKYVTATEIPSLLGLNPWRSAAQMWDEKIVSTFTGNAYTIIGTLLEPVVVELTNHALDRKFKLYEGRQFFTDDKLKIGATPDAYDEKSLLECKTTKPANIIRYSGTPPTNYVCQLMVQLMLEEKENGYLSLMSTDLSQFSQDLHVPAVIYKVEKSPILIKLITEQVERFWEVVAEGKRFRVASDVKRKAKVACTLCAERIF